jgi:hypothetical protein
MTLKSMAFKTSDELVKFANTAGLTAADVQQIWERGGTWFLFYWE